jgi:hypothetical protein
VVWRHLFLVELESQKSTVHHWLKEGGTPSLEISLKIAAHYGLSLKQLLTGELSQWQPPVLDEQLAFELLSSNQTPRNAPRTIDWTSIEEKLVAFLSLPKPISVLEAARRFGHGGKTVVPTRQQNYAPIRRALERLLKTKAGSKSGCGVALFGTRLS